MTEGAEQGEAVPAPVLGAVTFENWYRTESPRLTAVLTRLGARPEVAKDLAAEAFSRALERWDRVGAMASPSGWVFQVGLNLLRRHVRRASLETRLLRRSPPPPVLQPGGEIWDLVRRLPERQRQAVVLVYLLDLSYSEAGRLMGVAEGTIGASLSAARHHLSDLLRGQERDGG